LHLIKLATPGKLNSEVNIFTFVDIFTNLSIVGVAKRDFFFESIFFLQGEEYQLFWPKELESVRMAARFGAKIVPFGAVGEDDIGQISLVFFFLGQSFTTENFEHNIRIYHL